MTANEKAIKWLEGISGAKGHTQIAEYLNKKYDLSITRQQIYQFTKAEGSTIANVILRFAVEQSQNQ